MPSLPTLQRSPLAPLNLLEILKMAELSHILQAASAGDPQAAAQLFPLVYDELRRLAAAQIDRERPGHSLQATALVHEAYLRLLGPDGDSSWGGRRHFFAAAGQAMRRILVENARRKHSLKRGGEFRRADVEADELAGPELQEDVLALDEALEKLATVDPAAAELVHLRYFVGLTSEQAAETLGVSVRTAGRLWTFARAWLRREIEGDPSDDARSLRKS